MLFNLCGPHRSGLNAHLGERAPQSQRVAHGGEHAHVIRGRAVHATIGRGETAPDVSAPDHNGDLHAEVAHFFNALGNIPHDSWRNIVSCATLSQRFAAQFEDNAFVGWRFLFHGGSDETRRTGL